MNNIELVFYLVIAVFILFVLIKLIPDETFRDFHVTIEEGLKRNRL